MTRPVMFRSFAELLESREEIMSNRLEQELTEVLERLISPLMPEESWWERLWSIATESADVIAHILDAVDDENRLAELAALERDAAELVEKAIKASGMHLPKLVINFLPSVVSSAIRSVADKGEEADDFIRACVIPVLQEPREALAYMINRLQRVEG